MDIHSLKVGDKLICADNKENNWGSCDSAPQNLSVGETYIIEKFEIHSWHTKIWLKEKPGKVFNSVHFEISL